jgi:hypothetical protein
MRELDEISAVAIYPAIGIARIGNGPNEYFIGQRYPGSFLTYSMITAILKGASCGNQRASDCSGSTRTARLLRNSQRMTETSPGACTSQTPRPLGTNLLRPWTWANRRVPSPQIPAEFPRWPVRGATQKFTRTSQWPGDRSRPSLHHRAQPE